MKSMAIKGLSLAVVLSALSTVGCTTTRYKQQIATLEAQCNDLSAQKIDLQGRLNRAAIAETSLQNHLKDMQLQLVAARMKTERLEKLASKPSPVTKAPKRETAVKTLASDILFASGKASLTGRGKRAVNTVVTILKRRYPGRLIRIYGHTDNDPIKKSGWKDNSDLSAHRAAAVKQYLVMRGLKRADIETVAMGASRPAASNRTVQGKARNRRVEIVVVSN